jgi:hypothetical protein
MLSYASVRGEEVIPSTGEVDVRLAMLALLEGTYVCMTSCIIRFIFVMSCHVMSCHVMSCHVMFCSVLSSLLFSSLPFPSLPYSSHNLRLSVRAYPVWIIRMAVWGIHH